MDLLEGFGNNAFSSKFGDTPIISDGPSAAVESVYKASKLPASFDAYKKATPIRRSVADTLAPSAISASEYMRRKYGDFSSAVEIGFTKPDSRDVIVGTKTLTKEDLKVLRSAVDKELLRLERSRSVSLPLKAKENQLALMSSDLDGLLGKLERNEITLEQVPIDPQVARKFLSMFRSTELLPVLFDPDGPKPRSAPPSVAVQPASIRGPLLVGSPTPSKTVELTTQELFDLIQRLKWEISMDFSPESALDQTTLNRIQSMEKRILDSATSEYPIPIDLRRQFLNEIQIIRNRITR
jgi:hypothetical protein